MAVTPSPTMRAMVCVQGAQARTAGLPITGNPYADTKLQRAWDDGWTHAVQPQLTGPTYTRLRAALERLADVCPVTPATLPALDEACAILLETAK